jgi:hypothetical protein
VNLTAPTVGRTVRGARGGMSRGGADTVSV